MAVMNSACKLIILCHNLFYEKMLSSYIPSIWRNVTHKMNYTHIILLLRGPFTLILTKNCAKFRSFLEQRKYYLIWKQSTLENMIKIVVIKKPITKSVVVNFTLEISS